LGGEKTGGEVGGMDGGGAVEQPSTTFSCLTRRNHETICSRIPTAPSSYLKISSSYRAYSNQHCSRSTTRRSC